ncbi:MAG: PQQ-like beta-propeller repeat protein [Sandaracinaceae bacterium]|nr:PQQ-like beta-propeller repeat protein [Sandaracinaceae bacterium]
MRVARRGARRALRGAERRSEPGATAVAPLDPAGGSERGDDGAGAPAPDGDRLAVARVLGAPPFAYPRAVGAHVFGWGGEGAWNSLVAFGPDRAEPVRITPLGTRGIPASAAYTDAVVSDCLMTVDGEDLVATDPVAGAARWRAPLPIPASVTRRRHPFVVTRLARAGDVLVGFVGDPVLGSWAVAFGLSFRDGRVLWQRGAPAVALSLAASDDRVVALIAPQTVQAIDPRTGAVAWEVASRAPWRGWESAGATRDAFVVVREREVLVLEAATGARRALVRVAPSYVDTLCRRPVIDGDDLFVVLLSGMVDRTDLPLETALAAYDLRTGARRWRAAPRVSSCLHQTPMMADARSVLGVPRRSAPSRARPRDGRRAHRAGARRRLRERRARARRHRGAADRRAPRRRARDPPPRHEPRAAAVSRSPARPGPRRGGAARRRRDGARARRARDDGRGRRVRARDRGGAGEAPCTPCATTLTAAL